MNTPHQGQLPFLGVVFSVLPLPPKRGGGDSCNDVEAGAVGGTGLIGLCHIGGRSLAVLLLVARNGLGSPPHLSGVIMLQLLSTFFL